jgi:redox-sensitive bicupin YhaK (pirin superfamily)
MMTLRPARERGHGNHGWLDSWHSFSFSTYQDPRHMGFGALRVINEDRIAPGTGFGTHGHRDMEIISWVLEGELAHRDSMGNGSAIVPGDLQRMSAGRGVQHSEFNHAPHATTHFLQIWIEPAVRGSDPSYEQKHFPAAKRRGQLCTVASEDGRQESVRIQQDALLLTGLFDAVETASYGLPPGRRAYVHLARGALTVNGQRLTAGDALKIEQESVIAFSEGAGAEVLLFDLA